MSRFLVILILFWSAPAFAQDAETTNAGGEAARQAAEHAGAEAELAVSQGSQTEKAVRAAIARLDELKEVKVSFGDGIATLTGTVERTDHRDAAETITSRIDGVIFVDNDVIVSLDEGADPTDPTVHDAEINERLERIFANVEELSEVEVAVRAGVVRLDGTVLNASTAERAEELAAKQDGVVYVENALEEERAVAERVSPAFKRASEILSKAIAMTPLFVVALIIFLAFWLLARLLTSIEFPYRRLKDKPLIAGIVKQAVRLVISTAGIVLVLELFDLTSLVGAVLGTAGVAGLAIGFAFKDIGENYLASIILSIRQPFEKNDVVEIGELEGKVVRLTTRETILMTLDGNHLRIPNSVVFGSVITNFTRNPLRRIKIDVGVGVGENLQSCLRVGRETLEQTKGILLDPKPYGLVRELGDFTVNVRFFAWIDQTESDYYRMLSESTRRVKVAFDQAGIDMPEPTSRVLNASWSPPPPKDVPPLENEREEIEANDEERPSEQVDEQIEKDRKASGESDLLD